MALHPTWVLATEVLAGLNHPLLTLVSPVFLEHGLATYRLLRQGGYTELVVYLTQQIQQFRLRGEEFAMQHLGTEDQLKQAVRELAATMSPEELVELVREKELKQVAREIAATMPPEELVKLVSDEELVRGLTPERLEHLRRLLEQRRPADGNASGTKTS